MVRVVIENPGITKRALIDHPEAKGVRSRKIEAAIVESIRNGYIYTERGSHNSITHYPTGTLPEGGVG